MKVRVTSTCYYAGRIRKEGTILEIDDKYKNKLPSWAQKVNAKQEEQPQAPAKPVPTTLHDIAAKPQSKVSKANVK